MDGLQIKQVAKETGLTEQVIRKWEQRYAAVTPRRLENGYRIYSTDDVRRLLRLKQLVAEGIPVSRAVRLLENQNPEDTSRAYDTSFHTGTESISPTEGSSLPTQDYFESRWVLPLLAAAEDGALHVLESLLQRGYAMYGLQTLVHRVILPFLHAVGQKWENGTWTEDQEHLASLTVRNFFIRRFADLPITAATTPTLLTSCVPGERHDIMLQIVGLEAVRLGYVAAFLGPSPAPGAIERAVIRMKPVALLLSMSTTEPLQYLPGGEQWFLGLDEFAAKHPQTRFFLGGPGWLVTKWTNHLRQIKPVSDLQTCTELLSNIVQ